MTKRKEFTTPKNYIEFDYKHDQGWHSMVKCFSRIFDNLQDANAPLINNGDHLVGHINLRQGSTNLTKTVKMQAWGIITT